MSKGSSRSKSMIGIGTSVWST